MDHQRFRATMAIFATVETNGERTLTSVPKGDVVTLRDGPESGSRLVDVDWKGVIVRMSVTDLLEHATMLFTVAI
jgi:hypothetical protein